MRPWSASAASGAFSAAEYEDAKRRVRRLDQTQAPPAREVENKSSRSQRVAAAAPQTPTVSTSSKSHSSTIVLGNARLPKVGNASDIGGLQKPMSNRTVGSESAFITSLQSNIRELASSIEERLGSNPQLRQFFGADFSELQLHLERRVCGSNSLSRTIGADPDRRLILFHQTENDRHSRELSSLKEEHTRELLRAQEDFSAAAEVGIDALPSIPTPHPPLHAFRASATARPSLPPQHPSPCTHMRPCSMAACWSHFRPPAHPPPPGARWTPPQGERMDS